MAARPIIHEFQGRIREARGEGREAIAFSLGSLQGAERHKRALLEERGLLPNFLDYLDDWKRDLVAEGKKQRVADQYASDLRLIGAKVKLADVTAEFASTWARTRLEVAKDSPKTLTRRLSAIRNYWEHRLVREAVGVAAGRIAVSEERRRAALVRGHDARQPRELAAKRR